MISRTFKIGLLGSFLAAYGVVFGFFRIDNARLRQRIVHAREQHEQTVRLRGENARLRQLVQRLEGNQTAATRSIHDELLEARQEVAELEKHARQVVAQILAQQAADTQSLAGNYNPEAGLVRLENFANVGRSTPAAAFQTFVWAAMQGEDSLAAMIKIPDTARAKAEEVVASLPEVDRAAYPTAEKLAALFLASVITATPSAQIVNVSLSDPQHATVTVRGLTDKEQKVPMQWGGDGWQIAFSEEMLGKLGRWARSRPPPRK